MEHEKKNLARVRNAPRGRGGKVQRRKRAALALAVAVSLGAGANVARALAACPDCAVGRQARSEVWSDEFPFYLGVAALPFLVIGSLCIGAEAIGRTRSASTTSKMKGHE